MQLLNTQKNGPYEVIEGSDVFTPSQFDLLEDSSVRTIVEFKGTTYFFTVLTSSDTFTVFLSPAESKLQDEVHGCNWDYVLDIFSSWLDYLQDQLAAPNKWEQLSSQKPDLHFIETFNASKFTYQEYQELSSRVDQIKNSLGTVGLLPARQTVIADNLDHLIELAKEQNKFDWKNLFIGTMISVIIQLQVTPDNAKNLWNLIKQAFNNFLLP